MKKLTLTIVCAMAVSGAAFAQGTINWNSFSPAAITFQTNSAVFSPLIGGGVGFYDGTVGSTATASGGFYYELLYNTAFTGSQISGASAPSNSAAALFGGTWKDAGALAQNATGTAGAITGDPVNTSLTLPSGWNHGTTNNIVLVGWSSNLGTTWTGVSNIMAQAAGGNWVPLDVQLLDGWGFFGVSAAGYINPATGSPGAVVFSTAAGSQGLPIKSLNTQLYLVVDIPEPATMALVGLGGLSLLLFRRRK
ncbi:MAG: PEP-CTERM sorting domain-containing protein [Verrucomicrobiota bacterium]